MSDPRDARIAELEAELAGWKRVAVEAAIPLEVIVSSGWAERFTPSLQNEIRGAVEIIRRAVKGEGLPPPTPRSLTEGEKP